ncbi:NAD(P)H-hydrate dehydratase [Rhodanobacter sp. L36]|uniref:NAD(P)H-hydrate dehydratase n=1 Tax=Rhodanobacter sp. L36 TaxID=1747221 RepID=UPI00131C24D8|nr:NAD(P)H-hydrate dehydratase [Rhodanobacter sp. L36]
MHNHSHRRGLYTVEQMRTLESEARATLEISGPDLMRRAARAALNDLRRRWPQANRIGVYCGPGNNGGDGFLLAVLLRETGLRVSVMATTTLSGGDATHARDEWTSNGGEILLWGEQVDLSDADLHVDALYGIGLNRAPDPSIASLIERINASKQPTFALDVPSGLNADTGDCAGTAIRADATITFIADKRGLHTGRAADHAGEIELATLGVPESSRPSLQPDAALLVAESLPPRARYANKGNNGHVLVIGGDHGMAGAARLAGESALRVGAGLVSVATRASHIASMNAARPELMAHAVEDASALESMLKRATVLALGPGLGDSAWSKALWSMALDASKSLVLDADGLNLLAKNPRVFSSPTVLTPHPGEAARLLGKKTVDIEKDRFAAARELAKKYSAVVVLKGSGSLIADPNGRLDVCPWGNPGMASGGMGDLLTGVVAALLAQGCPPWEAACLGVSLHARAGDVAARNGERGLLASDLLAPLRVLVNGVADDHG